MPEIRIRYDDDGDRMPYSAIAAVQEAAAQTLPVTRFEWIRDDEFEDDAPPANDELALGIRPRIRPQLLPPAFRGRDLNRPEATDEA